MPNPAARGARRIDRPRRRSSPCAGRFCRRTCAIVPAVRGPRAGPAQCAEDYLAVNASKWRNVKHRKQWVATLTRYTYPVFGNLSVAAIDSGLVFKALKPLVAEKPVTASRVRGRIETVLDFARAVGRRDGVNPADKAIIGHLLPLRSEKAGVRHQPALPFGKLPTFMTELRQMQGLPARLLELIILTGCRPSALVGQNELIA